ncbi:hypothetical protein AYO49_06250 [Verrucomicrobiaceae bacterium SCGC AG-212-N21]|nr:hypothetical protein AYO49_06250 [Verrucomicrobiaceae bacterium SCGC AG-212-N21]
MSRLLAIGDIHGCATALDALLDVVRVRPEDTLVTLGDYVNRGPDSKGVLDRLCALQAQTHLVPLRGNHEAAMLDAFGSRGDFEAWLLMGGDATLRSYGITTLDGIPPSHCQFLRSLRSWYESENHFFVHANVRPEHDLEAQDDHILFWAKLTSPQARHKSGKTMICGHTPQQSGMPRNWGFAVCIDTAAARGGWLTCLDVRAGHYWQADDDGRTREDDLEPVCDYFPGVG